MGPLDVQRHQLHDDEHDMVEPNLCYQDEIAQEFGLDQTTVGVIVRNAAAPRLPPPRGLDDQVASTSARDDRTVGRVLSRAR